MGRAVANCSGIDASTTILSRCSRTVLRGMRWSPAPWGLASMLVTFGCSSPTTPVAPPTPAVDAHAPSSLTVGMSVGMGADAGRAEITAKVQGPTGSPLGNVPVAFATDTGTLSADQVTTNDNGIAGTTLTASSSAHLTVNAGTLSSRLLVPSEPPPPAPPASTGPADRPSTPGPGALSVSLGASSALTGASMIFTAGVQNAAAPESYLWSFGDGAAFRGLSASTAHVYAAAGSYPVTVTVTDAAGRSAAASSTATVTDPPPPPTQATPTPSYTVTLTASQSSVVVLNGSILTAAVSQLNGAPPPSSYAWDCNGDGTTDATTSINTTTCTYNTVGTITSKVTVNGTGATGSATVPVTVIAAAPLTVDIVPDIASPAVGVAVNFTATVTSAGPIPAAFQWEWDKNGDGTYELTIASAPSPNTQSVTFFATGVKSVKVRVTDTATGRTATSSALEITVH